MTKDKGGYSNKRMVRNEKIKKNKLMIIENDEHTFIKEKSYFQASE